MRKHDAHFTALHVAREARKDVSNLDFADVLVAQPNRWLADDLNAGRARALAETVCGPFAHLCRAAGLPEPRSEYRFHEKRQWRFDYAWPAQRVALEVEGGLWTQGRHTRGVGALADLEKYSEAAIAGWRIVYCTPADLVTAGVERVRRALG